MTRKAIWVVAALLLVGVSFWAGNFSHDYLLYANNYSALSKLPTLIGTNTPDTSGAPLASATGATASNVPVPSGPVKVTAITPTSITVQTGFGKTKTFTLSATTPVYSVVSSGQTGRGLSDITPGTYVNISSLPTTPTVVYSLAFNRDPSLQLSIEDSNSSILGTITQLSGSAVTVTPTDTSIAPVTITLDPSTKIITQVTAGQKGRDMAVGAAISVGGLTKTAGVVTAKLILLPYAAK